MQIAKTALLATIIAVASAPALAQTPTDKLYELARSQALSLIGLSPAGVEIYARRSVAFSENKGRFGALSRLKVLLGNELARKSPDMLRVTELSRAVAREQSKDAQAEYEELVETAFQLPDADRRKLGDMIARNNGMALGF